MTVVVGTAGHIDHGKTAILRALTGIDADRLPEERRRGMTIDVGYAHLALPDGSELDFVDVPGHDRLVGNMLVGAGEIDAALVVVAADDGPRAQTLEHLELLDGLGIAHGLAVVSKIDLVDEARVRTVRAAVASLLEVTSLRAAPVVGASTVTFVGIDELRTALIALRDGIVASRPVGNGPLRLPIDRVFAVRGRGAVVTGSLRGGVLASGSAVRIEPGGLTARARELQVHGRTVGEAGSGRTAVNLAGVESALLRRGQVVTEGEGVEVSDRLLVALRPTAVLGRSGGSVPGHGARLRLHVGTEAVEAFVARSGRDGAVLPGDEVAAILRLERPIAVVAGDRFVLRQPSPARTAAGGRLLDPLPPRGVSRRRASTERLAALASARDAPGRIDAVLGLHGALTVARVRVLAGGMPPDSLLVAGPLVLAPDIAEEAAAAALAAVEAHETDRPLVPGLPAPALVDALSRAIRQRVSTSAADAAAASRAILDGLVAAGRLVREGARLRRPGRRVELPAEVLAAMDRVERALDVPAPPPLHQVAAEVGCPAEGVRRLLDEGRIVRLTDDVAYAARTLAALEERARVLAAEAPLAPATFRDATGTSRKYVLAILEDLDRRGILRRTPEGHVPGPRGSSPAGSTDRTVPA